MSVWFGSQNELQQPVSWSFPPYAAGNIDNRSSDRSQLFPVNHIDNAKTCSYNLISRIISKFTPGLRLYAKVLYCIERFTLHAGALNVLDVIIDSYKQKSEVHLFAKLTVTAR